MTRLAIINVHRDLSIETDRVINRYGGSINKEKKLFLINYEFCNLSKTNQTLKSGKIRYVVMKSKFF